MFVDSALAWRPCWPPPRARETAQQSAHSQQTTARHQELTAQRFREGGLTTAEEQELLLRAGKVADERERSTLNPEPAKQTPLTAQMRHSALMAQRFTEPGLSRDDYIELLQMAEEMSRRQPQGL